MSRMGVPLMADWLRALAVRAALSRAVRRMTGVAPGRLTELMAGLMAGDEAFWFYRLLGERFG